MAEKSTLPQDNQIEDSGLRSGYDIPLTGMEDGHFLFIHILAVCFIFLSLGSATSVLIASIKEQKRGRFFSRTKVDRFVVYLAMCDGLFSVAQSMDHLHMIIKLDHVHPKELCTFYGFWNSVFIGAQNLLVSIIAINAFLLTYLGVHIRFGRHDWKLLTFMFGLPLVIATIAAATDSLGPNGASCFFDGVKGKVAYVALGVGPRILIFTINVILYSLTASKLFAESARLKKSLGSQSVLYSASKTATRNMILFVLAFCVQWWALTAYGKWQLISMTPPNYSFVASLVVLFSNTGGVLNGLVFLIIRRRKQLEAKQQTTTSRQRNHARAIPSSSQTGNTQKRDDKEHEKNMDVIHITDIEVKVNIHNEEQRCTPEEPIGFMEAKNNFYTPRKQSLGGL